MWFANLLNFMFLLYLQLDNEIIREEIKTFSDWPTFPQLFVESELVGGVDILIEMHKDGSLKKLFSEKKLIP